jgi:cyclopropane-fatty-acyl-phospholipid synthase
MSAPPDTHGSAPRSATGSGRVGGCSSSRCHAGGGPRAGAFIESYIAADMHMRPVGETVSLLEDADLEILAVESLRTHYVRTIRAWLANLERDFAAASAILGEERARLWRLYLAGGALAFEEGRMGVDQILAERPDR